jgi:hypothetical protein
MTDFFSLIGIGVSAFVATNIDDICKHLHLHLWLSSTLGETPSKHENFLTVKLQ